MKKVLSLMLLAALLVMPVLAEAEISIAATSYPLYDMAKIVGGDAVEVTYVPDAQIPEGTQIVLCMANEVTDAGDATVISAVNKAYVSVEGDTSCLTAPINNAMVARALTEVLQSMDADNMDNFANSLSAYTNDIIALDAEIRTLVDEKKNNGEALKVTCADSGSLACFAKEYGVEYAQDAPDAIELSSYEHPADEDLEVPYIDLMRRNLEALAQ